MLPKELILQIIFKLVYARDEEYMKFYQRLKESILKQVIECFNDNWHSIREQWWKGLNVKHAII